ncbi:type II secretion system protein [Uliginosibacterium gangwonense]|uniref:type II secretion system protein n=1 Tax=Uliginosibacterium gangwonense TaxID=392736 RepID=UPI00037105FE|nr:type II secretion system protein [Uliginosibacterium gangwonense]
MNRQRGFTLVEIAVVLVIMGAMLGLLIAGGATFLQHVTSATTYSRQATVKTALLGYLRDHGRLPCPAADAAGVESSIPVSTEASAKNSCGVGEGAGVKAGVVPYATLGLTQEMALDGWGNFYTYVVSSDNATTPQLLYPRDWVMQQHLLGASTEDIKVDDGSGTPNPAVAVLISHGPSGEGAYTTKNTTIAISTGDTYKQANKDGCVQRDSTGLRVCYKRDLTDTFDDYVFPILRDDLVTPLYAQGVLSAPVATFNKACQDIKDKLISVGLANYVPASASGPVVGYNISPNNDYTVFIQDPTSSTPLKCEISANTAIAQSTSYVALCDTELVTAQSVTSATGPMTCRITTDELKAVFARTGFPP